MLRKVFAVALILVASGGLLNGCGSTVTEQENGAEVVANAEAGVASQVPDASILGASGVNAFLADTPEEWLRLSKSPVALTGTIASIDNGFSALDFDPGKGYHDVAERTAVVKVAIDTIYAGESLLPGQEYAYVSVSRGLEVLSESGVVRDPSTSMVIPLESFRESLPVGTRVVVISGPRDLEDRENLKNVEVSTGYPAGAVLLGGLHPQSFSLVLDDETVTGWDLSYADIIESLTKATTP